MKQTDLFTSPGLEQVVQNSNEKTKDRIEYLQEILETPIKLGPNENGVGAVNSRFPGLEQVIQQSKEKIACRIDYLNTQEQTLPWPDPTEEQLNSLWFNQIWEVIKDWDINVPGAYTGYCSANGNHVVAILNALTPPKTKTFSSFDEIEQWK